MQESSGARRKRPAVSVLVPVYNVERYLEECLDSLLAQVFTDFEVICINDGSSDGSREIVESYLHKDMRFRVIDKSNSGYGDSMNKGLAEALGDYIAILESDDFFEPHALELLHTTALHFDAQVVKANFRLFWSLPQPRDELFPLVTPSMANRPVDPRQEFDIYYLKPSIWSALYRRSFLEENGIAFLETPGASYQDASFNFKVWASATRCVFLEKSVLYYRQDNEASSVNAPGKVYCVCDEYAEMERFLDKNPDKKIYLETILAKMRYDSYMWNYERLSEDLQKEFIVRFSEDFAKLKAQGSLDLTLFEPWKVSELSIIMKAPLRFHEQRRSCIDVSADSAFSKMSRYYKLGGFSLLAKMMRDKVRRS